ncbi:Bax inhibitor-1/YccA family protein [Muribaculaceae bacterium Isolate-037 (Harlan)]|uniref:Bax inhibitor-1/YccA family protein n=2 Tax=Lepagella muris TaxID=3032870 RepID=A0AC61RIL1_9BACT|nr:Bax inhibitor-1/YccA family protein [Muribaculaceae bacterium Isolate-037 (Harlan)]TGY79415.1 Bax inhibitor-1/YccA family protein [Lepagella muris]THG52682.1 Bax inhibitor-1/YccA family protein [Bacteroidales bacterium]TKC62972.1 Bax inhibitor-1/YccA family protein [Bacteroidales bacterium]
MTPPPYYGSGAIVNQVNSVMKRVYVRMFIGLLISAFCALGVASSAAAMQFIFGNQLVFWGMFIVMLAMAWILPTRMAKMSTSTCLLLFCVFSAIMGVWLAPIFIAYRIGTIVYTFFITAGTFGAMSVYGYFTKSDLSKMGTYLMMALFGLIIASVVNIFWANSTMEWIISIVGVLIFTGLTAWDTQQVKRLAAANLDPQLADKLATMGALNLYLDFINLFLFLLRIFGGGSRD